jgi:ribosomal protein S18 acetylase RimI-like enzyme
MIRSATENDSLNLAALSIQVWLDSYATNGIRKEISKYVLSTFTKQYFIEILNCPKYRILVFIENDHLVGYILANLQSIYRDDLDGYEIEKLYVQQHFQGKGIGRALLSEMSKRHGGTYWLSTWKHNQKAIGFYKHLGFLDIGSKIFELDGEFHENRVLALKTTWPEEPSNTGNTSFLHSAISGPVRLIPKLTCNNGEPLMMVLVVGASGATGRLLVEELLSRGLQVRAVVRSLGSLSDSLRNQRSLSIVKANLHELSEHEMIQLVSDCTAVASCLGHNLTFKGIYGPPRKLVADVTRRLCEAIRASQPRQLIKFVLMNTAGNRNRNLDEPLSISERSVVSLIRLLLPPFADNEEAADYLRTNGSLNDSVIEWAVVRPDTLVNENSITEYDVHPSPTRSAIFNAGKTSRVNVAHFIAALIIKDDLWSKWKGRMPVIYNKGFS